MSQPIETLHNFSILLYYYYLSYKKMDLKINDKICNELTSYLINIFKLRAPYFNLYSNKLKLDSFSLFEFPFDEPLNIYEVENVYSLIYNRITEFPNKYHLIICNDYTILSLYPIPFEAVDITHGDLVKFFTPIIG